ncbi:MAG: outer membrane beta-barrel protein, partial [Pseudomonadota bacterium]
MLRSTTVLALAASAALTFNQSSFAADQVAPAEPEHVWSGFYAGIGIGAGAVVHDVGVEIPPIILGGINAGFNGIGGEGIFGEATAGYDFATSGGFVFGVGANARYSGIATSLDIGALSADIRADYGFDVFARAGYLFTPQTLGYVVGGYSWQRFDIRATGVGSIFGWSSSGFTIGAGVETALTQRMHLKAEYRYSQYGSEDFGSNGILTVTPSFHTATLGLTYRLGEAKPTGSLAGAQPVDFTGFYVGGALAATGLSHNLSLPPLDGGFNGIGAEGFSGRFQAGYDYEFSNGIVAGVQGEFGIGTVTTDFDLDLLGTPGNGGANIDQDYAWSIIGRLGYKVGPRTLAYVLGGYTQERYSVSAFGTGGAGTLLEFDTQGFVAGAGIETALTDKVFVGLEYRYTDTLESFPIIGPLALDLEPSSHSGL